MSHYHDSDDLKILGEFKKLAPAEFKGFVELDAVVGRDGGAIPRKYRELIALAVACTTQCPYCLDVHSRAAKRAGATAEEGGAGRRAAGRRARGGSAVGRPGAPRRPAPARGGGAPVEPAPADTRAFLAGVSLFREFSPEEIGLLAERMSVRRLREAQTLFQEGDHGKEMF